MKNCRRSATGAVCLLGSSLLGCGGADGFEHSEFELEPVGEATSELALDPRVGMERLRTRGSVTDHVPEALLAHVSVGESEVFFWRFAEDEFVVSESAAVGTPPVLTSELLSQPLAEVYRALAGADLNLEETRGARARPMPRETERPVSDGIASGSEPMSSPLRLMAASASYCDPAWFSENFCGFSPPNTQWCLLNHYDGAYWSYSATHRARGYVCPDTGSSVALRYRRGSTTKLHVTVLLGYYYDYYYHDGHNIFGSPTTTSGRFDVLNAIGDGFHFSGWMTKDDRFLTH